MSTATASRDPQRRAGLDEQAGAPGLLGGGDPRWQPAWDMPTAGSCSTKDAEFLDGRRTPSRTITEGNSALVMFFLLLKP